VISIQLASPFKGLVPFDDTDLDALLFFGRERESEIIGANVLAARLTVLYGPSGVGKTSVLRAGVAHRLNAQSQENLEERGHPEFAVVVFGSWSDDPVAGIRETVREILAEHFGSALLDEREGESLADTLERWTETLACDLLLILDQAEEYFLYHHGEGDFTDELPELVTRPGLRVRVLLAMRDDALAKLDRFKGRIPNLFGNYLRLDHLDRRAARDAVVKPVERYNELTGESIEVEPELVDRLLDETAAGQVDVGGTGRSTRAEVSAGRIEAPYLQLVLERVWEEERASGSGRLRAETLARLGGADAVVRAHLRRAVEELSSEERDLAADIFRHLVTPSGAKIAHGAGDLAEYASVEEQRLMPVLATLGRQRIVRTVDGAGAEAARYEIYHDVLGEAVLAWRREQELARERRAAERRHRRLAGVAIGALLALAGMTAVAIYALSQRSDARASARRAQASRSSARAQALAARAQSDLSTDPLDSIQLALQAAKIEPSTAAEDALRSALLGSLVRKILKAGGPVNAAAYNFDGSKVVTASADGTARVFRVRDGARLATLRHTKGVTDALFSRNGGWIVTSSRDKTARLWTSSGREVRKFQHAAPVVDLDLHDTTLVTLASDATLSVWSLGDTQPRFVFRDAHGRHVVLSRDGRRAAVFGLDRFARVYNISSPGLLVPLRHDKTVRSAAFGPSSEVLATGSADKMARVWNVGTFQVSYTLSGHEGQVVDVEISPLRGQFLATASLDGTATVWDLATAPRGHLVATLTSHTNFVNDVAFSSDGLYLVTSSRDGTARVWKTEHGIPQATLAGHDGSVRGASFNPSASQVLTYSDDSTARIWRSGAAPELRPLGQQLGPATTLDVAPGLVLTAGSGKAARLWHLRTGHSRMLRHHGPVRDAVFSPDHRLIATASADHTVQVRSIRGKTLLTLRLPAAANGVAFSPDSKLVAATSSDDRVRVWQADSGDPPVTLRARRGVGPIEFSADGRYLAAAAGNVVNVWRTGTWKRARTLRGHEKRIVALTFSHRGSRLATASEDGTARIWDISSGGSLELAGHTDEVMSARFSPDDRLLATASADHDVRLWNAQSGDPALPPLRAHFSVVSDARFSDDGRWLVSAGPGTAGLWDVRTGRLLRLLRGKPIGRVGPTGGGSIGILHAAAFMPGSWRIVTAGEDGAVRTYLCEVCAGIDGLEQLAAARLAEVGGTE
jgi:WD40 repeat protein